MSVAIAIALLINGVQVDLPAPALMFDDYVCVPARAVFEKLGYEVKWEAAHQRLLVSRAGEPLATLRVGETRIASPEGIAWPVTLPGAPRLIDDLLYVPVRAVTAITGARATWEGATLTVNLITAPTGEPAATELGEILANPPAWAGRLVRIRGEYLGWQADPFCAAVNQGPPVSRSDWILRDAAGSIYCARGPEAPEPTVSLSPVDDRGRRLDVTGVVTLADRGYPYLQVTEVSLLEGLAGIVCYLTTGRHTYQPGETLRMQMQVKNLGPEPVVLQFMTGQTYDFTVHNAEGGLVWRWSQGRMFTQMLQSRTVKPGEGYTLTEEWVIPETLPPGFYRVRGEINREVASYPKTIAVTKEE